MPWFGRLFDHSNYATAFRIATLFPVGGYLIWLALSEVSWPDLKYYVPNDD
jgi:hypothetical protein